MKNNNTIGHLVIAWLLTTCTLSAQVSGVVTNEKGEKLAFVSIYVEGSSYGTSTNLEGEYSLELEDGHHTLIFQYIGYKNSIEKINLNSSTNLNVAMQQAAYALDEVVIAADAEDPAYAIIRKAIAHRQQHKDAIQSYSCDVYLKGHQKILDAPNTIFGEEIGDLDGHLDSTRQGIVYLSESISRYHYQAPDQYKEVMTSSKLSGNDKGYSFNSAYQMDFSMYDNTLDLGIGREIVSPIADNALSYYHYQLEGTELTSEDVFTNKIKFWSKRKSDPAGQGYIYINEDIWNIHSVEAMVLSPALQVYFIDTMKMNQVYIPIGPEKKWVPFSITAQFDLDALGFKLKGNFSGLYSNYDLNPSFDKGFFDSELIKVEKDANKKDTSFWNDIRPIPLTQEEYIDYQKKDSIYEVRHSDVYLDSIDREKNKFGILDPLLGYEYRQSKNELKIGYSSPISTLGYNTVQGANMSFKPYLRKYFDRDIGSRLRIEPEINYGFKEKRLRATARIDYRFNRIQRFRVGVRLGTELAHFKENSLEISDTWNAIYSLVFRENFAKFYHRKRLMLFANGEIMNGLYMLSSLDFTRRSAVENHSDYSFFYKNSREFTPNVPVSDTDLNINDATLLELFLRWRPGQKYITYPTSRFVMKSKYPDIWLHFKQGLNVLGGESSFSYVAASVIQSISMGTKGRFEYYINAGQFFIKSNMSFIDAKHFRGNQIDIANPDNYKSSFLALPYYEYSTMDRYFQVHVQHHFNGYLLDRLPAINRLGWRLVVGAKVLKTNDRDYYREYHLGIDNIGIDLFRLLRLDVVNARNGSDGGQWGLVIGWKL